MSGMVLRLDTNGLRSLIADNPEFEIEIQNSVINNIRQDVTENAVRERITSVLRDMSAREGNWYNSNLRIKDQQLIDAMKAVVSEHVSQITSSVIKDAVADLIAVERTRVARDMKESVRDAILLALTPEMAKEILLAKLI